jgi:predicted enzyme related to lactoylglutathione lyase
MTFLFDVPGQDMAFFDCGGIRLYFGKPESEEFRSNPLIYYRVPAISDTYRTLLERGAESMSEPHVVHSTETTDLWIAGLRDPEGNSVMLMSEVPR